MRHIYLDYNATTPIAPSVQEAMQPFLSQHFGNPSSSHALGRAAHEAVQDAREKVASLLGCDADEIIFTSCGTESNNLALLGIMMQQPPKEGGHLIITAIEHPAVTEPTQFLARWGYETTTVGCDTQCLVNPNQIADSIRSTTRLVSVMHANNETGVLQPIREIADACAPNHVLLHTDAAQSLGKVPVNVDALGVDLLTIAGHKIYAPKGIGALYVRRGTPMLPVQHGAGHEGGLRAGTENVPYIVGLGKAAELAQKAVDEVAPKLKMLKDRLLHLLQAGVGTGLSVNGGDAPCLPNTLNLNFPKVDANLLLQQVPQLCASTGAACHSGRTHVSATLTAMNVAEEIARGAVRLSLGWQTSEAEIEQSASLLLHAWETLTNG